MAPGLAELARTFDTDKHQYADIYENYLASHRTSAIRLFEIGIGGYEDAQAGGGSLRMWRDYFAKGQIFGFDLHDKSAHAGDRIFVFRGDQTNAKLLNCIFDRIGRVDVIIDDGSHFSAHIVASFEALFPRLSPGGLYFVEDIGTSYWNDTGGSEDVGEQGTSLNYFLRGVHDINLVFHRGLDIPAPERREVFKQAEWIHFYRNLIVVKKLGTDSVLTKPG
jgi:hypothetical protein